MNKIRIAVASAFLAAVFAGAAVHGASAAAPSHPQAGPRPCCSASYNG